MSATNVTPATTSPPLTPPAMKVHFYEMLASGQRMWVRGWLELPSAPGAPSRMADRRGHAAGQLEIRVSGQTITTDVQLSPEGHFEAKVSFSLPPTRRGWRVARCKLTIGPATVEGCGVVLHPAADSREAIVVVLPVSWEENGSSLVKHAEEVEHLGSFLLQTMRKKGHPVPIYYLGVQDPQDENSAKKLAMALTALGWPAGTVVLLPAQKEHACQMLATGIDRFRWLFADALDISIVNLEERLASTLDAHLLPRENRARINVFIPSLQHLPALNGEAGAAEKHLRCFRPTRSYRVTRYPIVFCHGLAAFSALRMQLPDKLNYFLPMEPFLRERGFHALFPEVAATSGVACRAEQLREQILRWTSEPVNIIAHSMGGLDARYMITHLDMADRVHSLTTISTPHRGTYLADWYLKNYRNRVPLLLALEILGMNIDGFRDARPEACQRFNENTPDMPNVHYFSYGASVPQARVHPILRRAWTVLTPVEGPNDGMVSVASSHWGEYLGTIHADHFAQTPDSILVHPAGAFDSLSFYLQLAEDLGWRGF